jgi:hypothetical protein
MNHARAFLVPMIMAATLAAGTVAAQDPPRPGTTFFPDGERAFAPLRADPREAKFHLGFLLDDRQHVLMDFGMGAELGFLRHEWGDGNAFTLGGRGLIAGRFDFMSGSFDLQDMDFLGGLGAGLRLGSWAFDLRLDHQSSHLGDEVLESGRRPRIDFSQERLRLLASRTLGPLRLYGGAGVVLHAAPVALQGSVLGQLGVEVAVPAGRVELFVAADGVLRLVEPTSGRVALQVGVELGNRFVVRNRQRVFAEVFYGNCSMGQYYGEREYYGMVGVEYQLR